MARINKRSRSFSPYTYNIQYAKAGGGPNQQSRPYVKTAILSEDLFVISKLDPTWFVYVINNTYYTTNSLNRFKF